MKTKTRKKSKVKANPLSWKSSHEEEQGMQPLVKRAAFPYYE
jgi:hypothetical protein